MSISSIINSPFTRKPIYSWPQDGPAVVIPWPIPTLPRRRRVQTYCVNAESFYVLLSEQETTNSDVYISLGQFDVETQNITVLHHNFHTMPAIGVSALTPDSFHVSEIGGYFYYALFGAGVFFHDLGSGVLIYTDNIDTSYSRYTIESFASEDVVSLFYETSTQVFHKDFQINFVNMTVTPVNKTITQPNSLPLDTMLVTARDNDLDFIYRTNLISDRGARRHLYTYGAASSTRVDWYPEAYASAYRLFTSNAIITRSTLDNVFYEWRSNNSTAITHNIGTISGLGSWYGELTFLISNLFSYLTKTKIPNHNFIQIFQPRTLITNFVAIQSNDKIISKYGILVGGQITVDADLSTPLIWYPFAYTP